MKRIIFPGLVGVLLIISISFLYNSCVKETYDMSKISKKVELEAGLSLPIAYGSLGIENLIPTSDTIRKEGDSIRFVVEMDSIYSINAGEIINVNAGDIGTGIHATFFPPIIPPYRFDSVADQVISITGKADMELHRMTFKNGSIDYSIENRIRQPIIFVLGLPNTRKNNIVISDTITIAPHTTGSSSLDLTNAISDLTDGGTTINTLSMNYSIQVDTTGWDGLGFTIADLVVYNFDFNNIATKSVEGYFGREQFNKDSSMNLGFGKSDFFKNFQGGFNLSQPSLDITYLNSIGVPVDITLNLSTTSNTGTSTAGGTKPLLMPANVNSPQIDSAIIFDETDNMDEILKFPFPDKIDYTLAAKINPAGKTGTSNFITDESKLKLGIKLDIPLMMRSDSLIFEKAFPQNLPDAIKFINFLRLNFAFKNEFPFDIKIKVIPWDSVSNKRSAPILDTSFLQMPEVDNNGVTITPADFSTSIGITAAGLDSLKQSDHIILRARIDTKDKNGVTKDIRLLTSYKLDFKLGIQAGLKYNGDPFTNDTTKLTK